MNSSETELAAGLPIGRHRPMLCV